MSDRTIQRGQTKGGTGYSAAQRAGVGAGALGAALLVLGMLETVVTGNTHSISATEWFWVLALSQETAWIYLYAPVAFITCITAMSAVGETSRWIRPRRVAFVLACAALVGAMHELLGRYAAFRWHPPIVLVFVFLFGVSVLTGVVWERGFVRRLTSPLRLLATVSMLAAAGGMHVANYWVQVGQYPTLHLVLMQCELLVLWTGIVMLPESPSRRSHFARQAIMMATLAASSALGITARVSEFSSSVESAFRDAAFLGRSRVIFTAFVESVSGKPVSDPLGPQRFRDHANLPSFPENFVLEDHNILLIVAETTRYDKTSLANGRYDTTPNLARRAQIGWVAHRAYSPSSGTLHSMSALFAMNYPSMISGETWQKPWTGRLHDTEQTAAEALREVGYETFWVGYNHWFPSHLVGLDQGFDSVRFEGNDDAVIAKNATAALTKVAESESRFFGFVFFVSPHGPYEHHGYKDLPRKKRSDRYLHEIRFVDDQFEAVMTTLERTGLADNTIVIFIGDHGEEFGEHGGKRHKSTVYEESIHVPFVVWIPGMDPAESILPTSTAYLFPWLFSGARSPGLRELFRDRVFRFFGPLLRETQGAVLAELIGAERMKSTLIYEDLKINYDFISERISAYRPLDDVMEQNDVFGLDEALDARVRSSLDAYREVRAAKARYQLRPDVTDPSQARQ
ncbi:MAG: sulfatase-like hydrolase/transferase [Nannocystaceae bacterium]